MSQPHLKWSTQILGAVDKIAPNRLACSVTVKTTTSEVFYEVVSPGGFTSQEMALIDAECQRLGCPLAVKIQGARRILCGLCGVVLESSLIECEDPPRLQISHACLGPRVIAYKLAVLPQAWEAIVFAYPASLLFLRPNGIPNERAVTIGTAYYEN